MSKQIGRRATTTTEEEKRKRPLKTYGGRKSQDNSGLLSDSDDEEPIRPNKRVKINASVTTLQQGDSREPTNREDVTDKRGAASTLSQDQDQDQDPASCPTEQFDSSTRPLSIKHNDHFHELLTESTTASSKSIGDHEHSTNLPKSKSRLPGALTSRKRTWSEAESPRITLGEELITSSSAPASPSKPSQLNTLEKESESLSKDIEKEADGQDELSMSITPSSEPKTKAKTPRETHKSTSPSTSQADELDLEAVVPKENYQPRPSRSRSGAVCEELLVPADFSKRPETLSKHKPVRAKRRKTTAFQAPKEKLEDEDWQAGDLPGLEIKPLEKPMTKDILPVPVDTAEEQILHQGGTSTVTAENNETVLKASTQTAGKKPRGRPRKNPPLETISENTIQDDDPASDDNDDEHLLEPPHPKEITLAPTSAPSKSGRKRKAVGPNSPETENESIPSENSSSDSDSPPAPPPPKKRGRKRKESPPTCATSAAPPSETETIHDATSLPLQETSTNVARAAETPHKALPPPPLPIPSSEPEAQQQPQTPQPRKGPDKHSPLNSSKVAFRVGLSRRQRIAPLLRIVRK